MAYISTRHGTPFGHSLGYASSAGRSYGYSPFGETVLVARKGIGPAVERIVRRIPGARPAPPTPEWRGPTIGPAPTPTQPQVFCLNNNIACETWDFIRAKGGKFRILSPSDRERAIDIEQRILLRHWGRPARYMTKPAEWTFKVREEAGRRVDRIIRGEVQ
jgi:hypothetical protein